MRYISTLCRGFFQGNGKRYCDQNQLMTSLITLVRQAISESAAHSTQSARFTVWKKPLPQAAHAGISPVNGIINSCSSVIERHLSRLKLERPPCSTCFHSAGCGRLQRLVSRHSAVQLMLVFIHVRCVTAREAVAGCQRPTLTHISGGEARSMERPKKFQTLMQTNYV